MFYHMICCSQFHTDACTLLGSGEGWPNNFTPEMKNCQLCGSPLRDAAVHPGQSIPNTTYLITELNPFKHVHIRIKFCSSHSCSAMHQASVEKLGMI